MPILEEVRNSIPISTFPRWCFRGITFSNASNLPSFILNLETGDALRKVSSFTTDLKCALKFSDIRAKKHNVLSLQLRRLGYEVKKPILGLIIAYYGEKIHDVTELTFNKAESESWIGIGNSQHLI